MITKNLNREKYWLYSNSSANYIITRKRSRSKNGEIQYTSFELIFGDLATRHFSEKFRSRVSIMSRGWAYRLPERQTQTFGYYNTLHPVYSELACSEYSLLWLMATRMIAIPVNSNWFSKHGLILRNIEVRIIATLLIAIPAYWSHVPNARIALLIPCY
jgi:hypothetical protein